MIIKNGLLIDPVKEMTYVADLRISDGKIAEIAENIEASGNEEIIDASGKCVAPGLIDGHPLNFQKRLYFPATPRLHS